MKSILYILLIIILAIFAVTFTMYNQGDVALDFIFFEGEFKIALVILASVLFGLFLGWIAGVIPALGKGRQLRKVQKKLQNTEKEVENLRKAPITDEP